MISIHALRVEGDPGLGDIINAFMNFYPRPPGGGRRSYGVETLRVLHFYPRPPGGGRRGRAGADSGHQCRFLSTPSGWRATYSKI